MARPEIQKVLRVVEWSICVVCLICGALSYDPASPQWNRLFLPLYLSPLLLRIIPSQITRYLAFCLACLLIPSSLLGLLFDPEYRALKPNLRLEGGVTTDAQGYRAKPPVDYAKKKGIRIFTIGGSTTEEI